MEVLSLDIKDVLKNYTPEQWEELWKRLKRYTYKHYYWLPSEIGGVELDELIQDAIKDAIDRKRHWPPNLDLVTFLCGVIRSKAGHMSEKPRILCSIEDIPEAYLQTSPDALYTSRRESEDRHSACLQLCDKVREVVSGDELLSKIVNMWLDDADLKPRELARRLGVSIEKIRSAQKRLRRKIMQLREEWRNVQGG